MLGLGWVAKLPPRHHFSEVGSCSRHCFWASPICHSTVRLYLASLALGYTVLSSTLAIDLRAGFSSVYLSKVIDKPCARRLSSMTSSTTSVVWLLWGFILSVG